MTRAAIALLACSVMSAAGCTTASGGGVVAVSSQLGPGLLFVDAREVGALAESWNIELLPGTHVFELRRGAQVIASAHADVRANQASNVTLSDAISASDASVGAHLIVRSPNVGAVVFVDGVRAGFVTQELALPAGAHDIEVFKNGWGTYRETVLLQNGIQTAIDVTLPPSE